SNPKQQAQVKHFELNNRKIYLKEEFSKMGSYLLHEATWEPLEYLQNAPGKVKEFDQHGC
ncbi:698_t:CDS:2, partial [Dentiscutata erythropus]